MACASLGASTLGYLLTRQFELIAGLEMVDTPYKGAAQVYPDLMNGTVAVMLDNPSGSAGLVREGRLTGFAVTRPSAAVPNVPTFDSLGVKGFEDVFWYGVVAPPGLPPEIAERIQKILAQAFLADPGRGKLRAHRRRAGDVDAARVRAHHGQRHQAAGARWPTPRHQARIGDEHDGWQPQPRLSRQRADARSRRRRSIPRW